MSWQRDVGKLDIIMAFKEGTASQREHLNELVENVNMIVGLAAKNAHPPPPSQQLFYVNENGEAVKYIFDARKAQVP